MKEETKKRLARYAAYTLAAYGLYHFDSLECFFISLTVFLANYGDAKY